MGDTININCFNARGLGDKIKRNVVFRYLRDNHKGIQYLQETHSCLKNEKEFRRDWPGSIYFSHGTASKCGVAILVPRYIKMNVNEIITDQNGRYILIDANIKDENYILFNIYAPTKDYPAEQLKVFTDVTDMLSKFEGKNIIMAGDFNICLNPKNDKCGGKLEKISDYAKSINSLWKTLK